MTKVYNVPKEIKLPKSDFANYNHAKEQAKEDKFIEELRKFIKPYSNSKENGKIIKFPVADGYAVYMVVSIKPSQVIHLPLGDGWGYQYINRLTGKDIMDKIKQGEAMNKLFSK